MKVFLDDVRPGPEGWVLARWPEDVIELLMGGEVTHLSLDHDLGDDAKGSGYDVLTWIEETIAGGIEFVLPEIAIHTANPPARARMQAALDEIRVIYDMQMNIKSSTAEIKLKASRRELQEKWMQPELKLCIDGIKADILAEYGIDNVDRIVIIGSSVEPGFRVGESDVDLVVMTPDRQTKDRPWESVVAFSEQINSKYKGQWSKIDVVEKLSSQVHLVGTNYDHCYESSVLNGYVLYVKESEATYKTMSTEEARQHVVEQYLHQAWAWLDGSSSGDGATSYTVARSAARSLHSLLAARSIAFTPKSIRWNLMGLTEAVEALYPELNVRRFTEQLPQDLALIDFDKMPCEDGLTIRQRRQLIAIGIQVARVCQRCLGIKAVRNVRLAKMVRKHDRDDIAYFERELARDNKLG
jgi:hypothetical protein